MSVTKLVQFAVITAVFVSGFALGGVFQSRVDAQSKNRVFELRTYTALRASSASSGPLPQSHREAVRKARDHQRQLFRAAGCAALSRTRSSICWRTRTRVGETTGPRSRRSGLAGRLLRHPRRMALTSQVLSVFVDPLDFSQMK